MRVKLVVDSATTEEMRAIVAALSQNRASADIGMKSSPDWRPRINCEGPDHWGLETDKVSAELVIATLGTLR